MGLLNLVLSIAWIFLTGEFTPVNFIFGLLISFLLIWLVSKAIQGNEQYAKRVLRIPSFVVFFLSELAKANFRVAHDALTPTDYMTPGIIAIPLDAKTDLEITLLANLISLTPGSLSIDVSHDRSVLYVHAMYVQNIEEFQRQIKEQLEARLLRILR